MVYKVVISALLNSIWNFSVLLKNASAVNFEKLNFGFYYNYTFKFKPVL